MNLNLNKNDECQDCNQCSFRSPIFDFLTNEELNIINEHRIIVNFKPGETIRKQGTYLSHVISVNAGLAKLYLEGENDKNLIIRLIKPSSFIGGPGMYHDQKHHYTITALKPTRTCFIDVNILKEIIHLNSKFADAFMSEFSKNLLVTYERLINLTQKHIRGRLADALIYLSHEISGDKFIDPFVKKQDIADLSSMSKDSVIKLLREFKSDGIIDIINNQIIIENHEMLMKISTFG
ncbi:MAG: Crp/Fnr family transcriptional regulator [Bacteroidales bacterium]|nr:Crp/Fnr family transcriptional regulator [Bacteroidales bacterium]